MASGVWLEPHTPPVTAVLRYCVKACPARRRSRQFIQNSYIYIPCCLVPWRWATGYPLSLVVPDSLFRLGWLLCHTGHQPLCRVRASQGSSRETGPAIRARSSSPTQGSVKAVRGQASFIRPRRASPLLGRGAGGSTQSSWFWGAEVRCPAESSGTGHPRAAATYLAWLRTWLLKRQAGLDAWPVCAQELLCAGLGGGDRRLSRSDTTAPRHRSCSVVACAEAGWTALQTTCPGGVVPEPAQRTW